jgi:transposase
MPKWQSNEKVNNLQQALTEPTSAYDIAKETGVHKSTVSRYFRRLFSNRTINTGGRPTLVSKVTKRLIKRKVIQGNLKTAKEVCRELVQLGYDISYQSAIKVIQDINKIKHAVEKWFQCWFLYLMLVYSRLCNGASNIFSHWYKLQNRYKMHVFVSRYHL